MIVRELARGLALARAVARTFRIFPRWVWEIFRTATCAICELRSRYGRAGSLGKGTQQPGRRGTALRGTLWRERTAWTSIRRIRIRGTGRVSPRISSSTRSSSSVATAARVRSRRLRASRAVAARLSMRNPTRSRAARTASAEPSRESLGTSCTRSTRGTAKLLKHHDRRESPRRLSFRPFGQSLEASTASAAPAKSDRCD